MKRIGKMVYNELNQVVGDFENDMLTYDEQIKNAELFLKSKELKECLEGLVNDVSSLLSDNDIEWQQAGYYNYSKKLLSTLKP